MGYTHYFKLDKKEFSSNEIEVINKIAEKYAELLRLDDDLEHDLPLINEEVIRFNGRGENGWEALWIEPTIDSFCKTNRLPYDLPVCEVLLVLKFFNKDFELTSDGFWVDEEAADKYKATGQLILDENWNEALENVIYEFNMEFEFTLEESIERDRCYYQFKIANI